MPVRWQASYRRLNGADIEASDFDPIAVLERAWSTRGCRREKYRHDLPAEAPGSVTIGWRP